MTVQPAWLQNRPGEEAARCVAGRAFSATGTRRGESMSSVLKLRTVTILLFCAGVCAGQDGPEETDFRREALQRTRAVAGRMTEFKDARLAVERLGELAEKTCRYDAATGSEIFRMAAGLATGIGNETGDDEPERASELVASEARLLSGAAACGPDMRRELEEMFRDRPEQLLDSARKAALASPRRSADLLDTLLARFPELTPLQQSQTIRLLLRLRGRSPETSDAMFGRAMARLAASPDTELNVWMALGPYTFPIGPTGAMFVYSAKRSSRYVTHSLGDNAPSAALARAWLGEAAGAVLVESEDLAVRREFARQLVPKAAVHAPELVDPLEQFVAGTASAATAAADASGEPARPADVLAILRFVPPWRGERFEEAGAVCREFEDEQLRGQTGQLILFGEAARALGAGDVEMSLGYSGQLSQGLKRALIYYGIGSSYLAAGNRETGIQFLFMAAADADGASAADRAGLLLRLVRQMASVEPEPALAIAADAIRALNEAKVPADELWADTFSETLRSGSFRRSVVLRSPYVETIDLRDVIMALAGADAERTERLVEQLQHEEDLAEALVVVTELRLRRAFGPAEPAVRHK